MKLLPFQEEAVDKMVQFLTQNGGVYNASEMGLGKTIMTIATLHKLKSKKNLIITTAGMQLVWKEEIEKWGGFGKWEYVTSYRRMTLMTDKLLKYDWDSLVLDECHKVKSREAQCTKAMAKLWPHIKYKICLSGTPFTQSVMDCWTLFSRLSPSDFGDFWAFATKYVHIQETPFGKKFSGIKNHEELHKLIRQKFFVRYLKKDVLPQLPEKIWQKITLPHEYLYQMSTEEELQMKEYYGRLREAYASNSQRLPSPPTSHATIRKEQGKKKVPAIKEFCQNLLDCRIPIVIFAYHLDVINKLTCELAPYLPSVITGSTSINERKLSVDRFQNGDTNCFIGQMQAAGLGLTLTRSSTCILAEEDWSPSDIVQAVNRLDRIGQKNQVNVYYFVVDGSIDERIIQVAMEKAATFSKVLDKEVA